MIQVQNIIIGTGIIGLSIAREILKKSKSVVLIEKLKGFGMETSSRNSEVIHCKFSPVHRLSLEFL